MKRQVFTCDICKADNVPVREDFLTEEFLLQSKLKEDHAHHIWYIISWMFAKNALRKSLKGKFCTVQVHKDITDIGLKERKNENILCS